nr:uncharacterized mitochondrial protein AtMg00810-like [Tanacetum cinerariifolium]
MSTQQDIFTAASENHPPMLNKDNYVPWSSRIIWYARSRPNGKMIFDFIENGPYVRRMIATPGEPDLPVQVPKTLHEQIDEELTENDIRRMDADDQAIQTIILGLPEDVYAAVDSCETAKEIWEFVRQMMNGSDIEEQEKNAKLFNEWEKFTSTDGESIESYYQHFMQLMNDLKRNKHIPENIAADLKFLNNLQPKWKRHVTIVRQIKNLHEADFTQIYDFLKMNQDENSYNFPATHNDQSSSSTHSQQSFPINNKYNPQPSLNQNFIQPSMTSLKDINDPTEAMNAALILFAKAFQLTTPANNNQRTSSNPRNRQIAQPGVQNGGNQNRLIVVPRIANQNGTGNIVATRAEGIGSGNQVRCYNYRGLGHISRNCTARPRRRNTSYLQTQLLIAQKEEAEIQLQAEEFDFMATAGDLDEIKKVNANYILMANLQHASTYGTQLDKALVYDTDGSVENDNHATSVALSMVQSGGTVETSSDPNEETRAHQETLCHNLIDQVAQEADESLYKQKSKELEIEWLLKASVSHDIMSIVQNGFVDVPYDLQTELDCTKEKLKHCIIIKEKEYAILWNNWYTKCEECKYDKILYDKAYNDMAQYIERLQARLGDLKGKSSDTPSASNTLDPLNQKNNISGISVTPHVDKPKLIAVTPYPKKLHASIPSHSVPQPREFNVAKHSYVIAPGMFKINPSQTSRVDLVLNNQSSVSIRTNSINNFQRHVIGKENVSSDMVNSSSTGLVHTARTKRPQPKGNTWNDRVPSTSKSSEAKKNVIVEDHCRNLSLSKNQKTMSSKCNNIKLVIRNDKSEIVCGTCKQCCVTSNHDACLLSSVNALNSRANNLCANVPLHMTGNIKLLINFVWKFMGTVRFGNDHIAAIMGYGDLKWGNITITRVYFVEGLGNNLFLVGQFCDADLEVAFRRNTCFIRDLDGVDLLKGNRTTNLYTINLYDMASASPICLMARAIPTKSWLWHQRLSHLNFDTINDLAKNDLVYGLPKFKYAKEHRCPFCEQGKNKRASYLPKPVLNSKQRLHLLHMDLCGLMRVASINGKWYVLVIVDDYSRLTWEYFDSVGITHETSAAKTPQQNRVVEHRNHMLVEAARTIVYNRRTKKIMETMNVTFDELSAMAFEQNSSKPGLQSLTPGQISFELELTYAPIQNLQAPTASMAIQDSASTPTNSSNTLNSSHNVDEQSQKHAQQQGNHTPLPTASAADNVLNAMFAGYLFVNPFATPSTESAVSSTQYVDPSNMHTFYQPYPHDYQWTKDHPLEKVIREPSRPVLTRNQLKTDGDMYGIKPLTLKWLFKNKHDEENTVIRNKTRLVVRGYRKEEGIDFKESFAPVAQMEAIRIFLAYAAHKGFTVYEMNVKKTFCMVQYVCQPKGIIDPALFTKRFDDDILMAQPNYVNEILKKYGLKTCNTIGTPMDIEDKLDLDQIGTPVDATKYRSMIGALMYLTSSRPDIVHATYVCARYQAHPAEKYLKEVKRIFRYLRGTVNMGLWYTKVSGFELTKFLDADYAGCKDTFKSTSGGAQFLGEKLVSWSSKKKDCALLSTAESEYVSLSACCTQVLWMRTQLTDYGYHFNKISIYCDSKSAIAISCNPV